MRKVVVGAQVSMDGVMFAHAAPVYPTVRELLDKLAIPISNEHTERIGEKAREHGVYVQTGSMLEENGRWPGRRLQHDLPDQTRRAELQIPEGEPLDSVRGPHQPARSSRVRRAALSGGGHADRAHRLRDLLRLAVPGAIRQLAANGPRC